MKISPRSFEVLSGETFVDNFFTHLAKQGEDVTAPRANVEIRQQVWQVAQDAARFGIVTVGGALVFAQIHWELGIDCFNHMAGLKNVADDPAPE